MKTESLMFFPQARSEGLITKELEDEVLIYDSVSHQAHCLNALAAEIWKLCDGRTTPSEIAKQLADGGRQTADGGRQTAGTHGVDVSLAPVLINERLVLFGIEELRRNQLLESPDEPRLSPGHLSGPAGMTRREAVRRIGLGAAIALPVVATIIAPTPAQAGTCKHNNSSCSTGADCCSGTCAAGHCLGG
jgi:hypothetical protein